MSTDDDSSRMPPGPPDPRYRVAMEPRFVWFLVGSAGLLAVASCWFLLSFTPNGLGLGFVISHSSKAHHTAQAESAQPSVAPSFTQAGPSAQVPSATSSTARPSTVLKTTAVPQTSAPVQVVLAQGNDFTTAPQVSTTPTAPSSIDPISTSAPSSSPVVVPPPVDTSTDSTPPVDTSTDTPTPPPPTTPAPTPDTSPLNVPGSPVQVDTMSFGTDDAVRTLTVAGLRLSGTADDPSSVIEWGDGTSEPVPTDLPADLTHDYATDGPAQIVVRSTDGTAVWAHTVTVSDTPLAVPSPTLGSDDSAATSQRFDLVEPSLDIWSAWTFDYGDQTSVSGTQGQPTADEMQHDYDGSGHTARLTVVGPDGQVGTTSIATP